MSESIRVLYMENDPKLAKLCKKRLEQAGFAIDVAHDGKEGLAMYDKGSYSAVVVEHSLPVNDGLDMIRNLASNGPLPPMILITDDGSTKVAEEAIQIGASDTVVKDNENNFLDLLPCVIERAIRGHRLLEDKQRAEEALKESERKAQALYQGFPVPTYTWRRIGEDFELVDYNEAAAEMLPRKVADFLGVKSSEMFKDFPEVQDEMEQCYTKQTCLEREGRFCLDSTGDKYIFSIKYVYLPPDHVLIHTLDITKQEQAKRALQESEERYWTLVGGIPVGIYRTTPEGEILDVNPATVEMLGYPNRESLMAVNATDIFLRPEDRQREQQLVESEGVLHGFEVQVCRKDGTVIWVWDTVRAVRSITGKTLYYEGSLEDITKRKQAEEELHETNRRLDETLVQLQETQHKAILQARLAAVGQLAAGVAHDFNNIMAAISLFSDLLLREPDISMKGRERLSIIIKQTQRAATLIRQILDFSRKTVMDLQPFDLVPFLEEFESLIERTLPENILLTLVSEDKECIVNADPGRIQQVFMNLTLNARDAMKKGGKLLIEITNWRFGPDQELPFPGMARTGWVRIRVADTGAGIPEDVLPYIYEPFFTTKEPGQGTGLGLAQVYGIVKQHNGFIDVESRMNEGTTFTVYLPALDVSSSKAPILDIDGLEHGEEETILVVEDDEAARQGICETLEGLNYQVLRAINGREALAFIGAGPDTVDLVLSDIVMPEMGGMDLYKELQIIAPELPLVLITGYPLGKGTRELLDRERVVWIQKPLDVGELMQVMRKMLRHRHN